MESDYLQIAVHLLAACVTGGAIGLERTFHGRPAGFRTHTLVCLTSTLLMLITVYQGHWMEAGAGETAAIEPNRMAQGIMTGIGFLGAGVIYKETYTVRGLTTAASIWITAAIGILVGVGLYVMAIYATLLVLGVLALFRHIERHLPVLIYAHYSICFLREEVMPEEELRALLAQHDCTVASIGYRLIEQGRLFEYQTVIRSSTPENTARLAQTLRRMQQVRAFHISPSGSK